MIELWLAYKLGMEKLAKPAIVHKSQEDLFNQFKPSSDRRSKAITKFNKTKKINTEL
jgi:hypothetical protein